VAEETLNGGDGIVRIVIERLRSWGVEQLGQSMDRTLGLSVLREGLLARAQGWMRWSTFEARARGMDGLGTRG
jgi:hypothetical protein